MPTSTGTVATKPRKNGIFDNVDVTKRSLLFKCLRVARSHRENTAIPSTEGLSEGHCHNPLQNNGLKNGYSRSRVKLLSPNAIAHADGACGPLPIGQFSPRAAKRM